MGVLNVTPDSFSDGGRHFAPDAALARGREIVAEGADLVDLGAESTRPGSAPVAAEEQWRRLEPVLGPLARDASAAISVDTSSAEVARRALEAGALIVNDVTAMRDAAMPEVVAGSGAGLVLMHMQGTPADMQRDPRYDDAAREVAAFLAARIEVARSAGIETERIALDPGIGFGKRIEHSLELVARIETLAALGRPVVIGASRKSFIGRLLDLDVDQRIEAGLATAAIAVFLGARVIRTHDVRATVRAVRMAGHLRAARA
ncbi:MAG: dihydropteroate synthase [Candidatus Eisenbacteria bacterium]|uniref:dihydropteroate synthase n=1 Tax=Eiseniibacteriota bacterium TaxID=2212470 RepID=A0A9D6QNP3_UNCEI|nr:dihydropteroate synthase [Candidatus Eisenbacteria bacterium]MBI3539139.1 dihydropteroate synthase [Candidatus Eisenbacteria bacterium]